MMYTRDSLRFSLLDKVKEWYNSEGYNLEEEYQKNKLE